MDPFGLPTTKISQFMSESKTGLDMTPFPGALNTPEKFFQTTWDNEERWGLVGTVRYGSLSLMD